MNKIYFGIPFALLLVFGIYNYQARDAIEAKKVLVEEQAKRDLEAKKAEEKRNRDIAIADAQRVSAENKRRSEEAKRQKEAEDAVREKERLELSEASSDKTRLRDEIRLLEDDLNKEKAALKAAQLAKQVTESERAFLQKYIEVARTNGKRFEGLVAKIDESEKAKAAAATARAASK